MKAGKGEFDDDKRARLAGAVAMPSLDWENLCKRDRLISLMLQDRRALRLLLAPAGYGKTTLASEYASRLFAGGDIVWVDGSSPEFVGGLDAFAPPFEIDCAIPDLVVFDDVPFLGEERVSAFRSLIDALLHMGVEVVASALPSNGCLRDAVDEAVIFTARDLMVTERDVRTASVGLSEKDRATRIENWRSLENTLFGHAPCSVWQPIPSSEEYLAAFFEERLPFDFLQTSLAMLMLGKGTFADVERMGMAVRAGDISTMSRDYPFLGVDPLQNEFSVGEQNYNELLRAIAHSGRGERLLKSDDCPCQACVAHLMNEGRTEQAVKLAEIFFSDIQCELWLASYGWGLLDQGEINLLEALVARCGERALRTNPFLQALQAWACGLQGDARESLYYAKLAMSSTAYSKPSGGSSVPYALAYLAFIAFCHGEPLEFEKPVEAPVPCSPVEYVAALVCYCADAELAKGLGIFRGQFALRNAVSSEEVARVQREREELVETLLDNCGRLCHDTTAFRLCLHLAGCLNSDPLRQAVQEYGCGIVIGLRKRGAKTFTEAMLVSDLWRNGFFGADAHGKDIRDSRLLDGSSGLLNRLSRMCGKGPCAIPWELGSPSSGQDMKVEKGKIRKRGKAESPDRLPVAKVTVFGGMEIAIGDRYIPESYWNHRSLQLFTVLVLHQGRDVSRDTLFSLLWPGLPKTRARDNFYTAWSHMQALLGEGPYLVRRGEFCSVSSRYVLSDVAEFNQLARRLLTERENAAVILDIYARMEALYRGGLLPGETGCEYIDQQREKYRSIYVDGMVAATHKSLEARDARIALWFARRAMDEDAAREDVYYALIRAQIASGQRCSAIRTYFQCRKFLSDELGLDPSTKTEALYEQLLQSDPTLAKLKPESFR